MRDYTKYIALGLGFLSLSGCALMQPGNNYASTQEDEYAAYSAQKSGTLEALEELGWSPSRRLTPEEQSVLEKRMELHKMERNLISEREREQYFNYKPYFENDQDRIDFLNLPNVEARDRFAMTKGIYFHANKYTPVVREAVSKSDIVLGMNKDAVIESWGEPETVEVAGSQLYGNEKWVYTEYVPSSEGYQKEERVVIFEGGKVVGWQKQ